MNKHGDQFLEMFKESFGDFSPEVPSAVYAGVRKKMFWSNFMGFNMAQLNIWYVLLATSSVALLSWSTLEQETMACVASESEYQIIELREPMMASLSTVAVEVAPVSTIQFSPKRTGSGVKSTIACASIPESGKQTATNDNLTQGLKVAPVIAEATPLAEESPAESKINENTQSVEQNSDIADQANLPVNMGGSLVEDSNLVDQLKKKDGPIELNIHVKKTSTKQ